MYSATRIQSMPSINSCIVCQLLWCSVPIKSAQVISILGADGLTDGSWRLSLAQLSSGRKGKEIADGFHIYSQMVVEEGYGIPSTFSGL